jgi:hypothetical protein
MKLPRKVERLRSAVVVSVLHTATWTSGDLPQYGLVQGEAASLLRLRRNGAETIEQWVSDKHVQVLFEDRTAIWKQNNPGGWR